MTKLEKRVLYLLAKAGGQAKRQTLSQAMSRHPAADRERALANVEALELVSSAKQPTPKGGRGPGGLVYWLTEAGKSTVEDLVARGELDDPGAP